MKFSNSSVKVPALETKHRKISGVIPAEGTNKYFERLEKVESRSMQGQLPIVWDRAQGSSIWDISGNKFIDFTSTIFVTNTGHSHPHLIKRMTEVMAKPLLHTYAYVNPIRIEYIEKLVAFAGTGFEKAFLLSAGTEATEAALKLCRLNAQKQGKQRGVVIAIEGNWHGRTMGAQLLSSNKNQKQWVGYEDPNILHIPFPYPWTVSEEHGEKFFWDSLNKVLEAHSIDPSKDLAGVFLETFQGWGAVFYPRSFVKAAREFCDQNKGLLIFDEMQAGFARTGKRFGYEHYKVKADLLCCGKGMSSGLALSGVIGSAEVMDLPEVGNMSSTHSANPLVCAAGLATLEIIENENLVEQSASLGNILHKGLQELCNEFPEKLLRSLGHGMIAALIFADPKEASLVSELCMQKGLLVVHTGRESIKFGPPLVIEESALREGLEVLRESCKEIFKKT